MDIIPVIDIMGGIAVSGKSGRRADYRALKTVFADSSNPLEIAKNLPFERLYVADLDGIMKGMPNLKILEELSDVKQVMVDAGIKNLDDYDRISHLKADIIIGSETLQDLGTLEAISREREDLIFSIDIKDGKVLSSFLPHKPIEALERLSREIKRFIVLDISSVGTLGSDFSLIDRIKVPGIEIYYGGGIKKEDIDKLEKRVDGALVGTALHNGLLY